MGDAAGLLGAMPPAPRGGSPHVRPEGLWGPGGQGWPRGCSGPGGCEAEGLAASLTLKELALHHLEFSALLIFVRLLICVFYFFFSSSFFFFLFPPCFKGEASRIVGTSWDRCCINRPEHAGSRASASLPMGCASSSSLLPPHGLCIALPSLCNTQTSPQAPPHLLHIPTPQTWGDCHCQAQQTNPPSSDFALWCLLWTNI